MRNQSVRPTETSHRSRSSTHGSHAHTSHHSSRGSRHDGYDSLSHSMANMALAPRERSVFSQASMRESSLPLILESRPIDTASRYSAMDGPYGSSASRYSGFEGGSSYYGGSGGPYASTARQLGPGTLSGEDFYRCATLAEFSEACAEQVRQIDAGMGLDRPGPRPMPPYPFQLEDFFRAKEFDEPGDVGAEAVMRAATARLGWCPEAGVDY